MQIDRFEDVLRALRENPEWLEELRALVFTDELLALPSMVAEQGRVQAGHTTALASHTTALASHTETLDSHTETLDSHTETLATHTETLATHTEMLARLEIRLDDAYGTIVEERYRNKAYGYFGAIATRIRQLHGPALDDVLEPLTESGRLEARERLDLLAADGIFDARRDGNPVRLVLEASVVVDTDDVKRARRRADLLARSGVATLPIVAGEAVTPPARRAAPQAGVWVVTDGRPEIPTTEDPDAA